MPIRTILIFIFLTIIQIANAQIFGLKKLEKLTKHSKFEWIIDTIHPNIILYFEHDSYAHKNMLILKEKIGYHITSTLSFVGIDKYDRPIHYFFIDNRQKMKTLIGWETNGMTNHKENYIVVIHSEKKKMAFLNHELFHLIAMNEWGKPERWINEGMAVYSDGYLSGHDLHQLSKYIMDKNEYISLHSISTRLRKFDSQITYPLLGSFMKFVDQTYGRETTKIIWNTGRKRLKDRVGKSLESYEREWLDMLDMITYQDMDYLK